MYYFIFERPASRQLTETAQKIEDEVVKAGIAGELVELTPARNVEAAISDAHRKGYQTLVVVGSSRLVNLVAARLLRYEMVLGIVPLTVSEATAALTGVATWQEAIVALRQRRWQYAAMGRIDDTAVILTPAVLAAHPSIPLTVATDSYQLTCHAIGGRLQAIFRDRTEPLIELSLTTVHQPLSRLGNWWQQLTGRQSTTPTRLRAAHFKLTSPTPLPLLVDSQTVSRTPLVVSVMPRAIKLIVARRTTAIPHPNGLPTANRSVKVSP